jgi:DNA polymerase III subunit epsilon
MYAIVDIETTGGHASASSITEVAIILHDGKKVEGRYHTLVNPQVYIPRYITAITGITTEMLEDAPLFDQVADKIFNLLQGRVFVAHNVNFDYSFLKHHLGSNGYELDTKKLCTVRLSRKIYKGLQSYSLGNLCRDLDISIEDRHRAMGDANATAILFEKLCRDDKDALISKMLKSGSREAYLPLHLNASDINNLPHSPGVYYFHDQKDKVIYVGKAVDLRKRVTSHFSNNAPSRRKQELIRNVHKITFRECGSEFISLLYESVEIKRLWPKYNYSQKKWEFNFGLFAYEDQRGIIRLGIERKRKNFQPLYTFSLLTEGHGLLRKMMREFELCPKHCFLQTSNERCTGIEENYCRGICEGNEDVQSYNLRVNQALLKLKNDLPNLAIMEEGRNENEKSVVLMEQGVFYGLGFIEKEVNISEREKLKEYLTPYPENEMIRSLILRHAEKHPEKIKVYTQ